MEFFKPSELQEAYALLDKYGEDAIPVAGTSFYMGHREELFDEVGAVISLKNVGLNYIKVQDGHLKLGATTRLTDILNSKVIKEGDFSIFAETVSKLKIGEVRNVGTVGGEVSIAGEVDLPTTLHGMDAKLLLGSAKGGRTISMADFHLGYLNNALEIGEMVVEAQVPIPPPNTGASFQKYERTATDLPIVNVMARVTLGPDGRYSDAKIAVGAAVAVPERATAAEQVLIGESPSETIIKEAAIATAEVECLGDHRATAELRSLWVKCAVEDALRIATERARGEVQ